VRGQRNGKGGLEGQYGGLEGQYGGLKTAEITETTQT
jgi:hypothetical protein